MDFLKSDPLISYPRLATLAKMWSLWSKKSDEEEKVNKLKRLEKLLKDLKICLAKSQAIEKTLENAFVGEFPDMDILELKMCVMQGVAVDVTRLTSAIVNARS